MVDVKKFVARSAREALAMVKAELGGDAVVLSNRSVPDGVEIVAMPAEAIASFSAAAQQVRRPESTPAPAPVAAPVARAAAPAPSDDDFTLTLGQHIARLAREQSAEPTLTHRASVHHDLPPLRRAIDEPAPRAIAQSQREDVAPAAAAVEAAKLAALEATNARLMDELASIKGMLERQLAGFAWNEITRTAPARTQLMAELLEAGFSSQLTRSLTEGIVGDMAVTDARAHVKGMLDRKLRLLASDADIIDRGGVYAIVGPTGVGKTTTTAKLAARCVVRHGADKVALITTDGYRIGAHEQLRIYGRILGVQVCVVRDAADLRQTLADLRGKHMVLIDTIGMGQRDKMVMEQAAMLASAGNVRRLLCLNATVRGDTLDEIIRAYDAPNLAGCIITKLDEAATIAPAIDAAVRNELGVFYVSTGQRVPEDLHLPNRSYVIHRALREVPARSAHKLDVAEAGLIMSAPASPVPRA
ncbi:flagellar biosynthesis protein FlhF [Uliginosibacterium sp. sgz301328]|uniref:flagellar biosynthesis protein FlhF n=1 Tax=Uliginosibacterium sp. sgz301328 TaxID=3243764 RepID=UPI00359EF2B8